MGKYNIPRRRSLTIVGDDWVNYGIQDMTGIEAFVNLVFLDCHNNNITSLDLSQNINLKELYCYENQLFNLNVTQNSVLTHLYCGGNQLTMVDVSQNTQLIDFECSQNQITFLDLSQNIQLIELFCRSNNISSLELNNNTQLKLFSYKNNQLNKLDIRNANNNNIEYFSAENNLSLTCIFVDDKNYSENNSNWHKDPTSHFVETQTQCDALGVLDFEVHQVKIYPNPIRDKFHIDFMPSSTIKDVQLRVIDLMGKKILTTNLSDIDTTIDIHNFTQGIYFINIYNNNKIILTKKIIKL